LGLPLISENDERHAVGKARENSHR
jgi:hypothetical protein